MLETTVKNALHHYVKESRKVILDPHTESDQHQNVIISRGLPPFHAYKVWLTSVDKSCRQMDTHTLITIPAPSHYIGMQVTSVDECSNIWCKIHCHMSYIAAFTPLWTAYITVHSLCTILLWIGSQCSLCTYAGCPKYDHCMLPYEMKVTWLMLGWVTALMCRKKTSLKNVHTSNRDYSHLMPW